MKYCTRKYLASISSHSTFPATILQRNNNFILLQLVLFRTCKFFPRDLNIFYALNHF